MAVSMNGSRTSNGRFTKEVKSRIGITTSVVESPEDMDDVLAGGRYADVPISKLHVDPSYQRGQVGATINQIAGNYDPDAIGVIHVSVRGDGTYWIIDGQQRTCGGSKAGIKTMPCKLHYGLTLEQEAAIFHRINFSRRPITQVQRHKAELCAGNPAAIKLHEICDGNGIRISGTGHDATLSCVAALRSCLDSNAEALEDVFPIVADISRDARVNAPVLRGLHWIECRLQKGGSSLRYGSFTGWITRFDADELKKAADAAARLAGSPGPRTWAEGIVRLITKGKRKNNELSMLFRPADDED